MAFSHGKDAVTFLNEFAVGAFIQSVAVPRIAEISDVTVMDGTGAREFIPGLEAATFELGGFTDLTAAQIDAILNPLVNVADTDITYFPEGDTFGNPGYALRGIVRDYNLVSTVSVANEFTAEGEGTTARTRVFDIHTLSAETGTATGSTHDNGAASSNGGATFLHCTAVSGTLPTLDVTVRHSTDNFGADDTLLATFAQLTAAGHERAAYAGTVKRFVRAIWTITGTTPSFTFHVNYGRD